MSKIPHRRQTAPIFAIWQYLSIAGNISTYHYTLAGWISHDVCQLCKTNPFHCTIHGDTSLQPIPPQTPPPNHSRFSQNPAVRNKFLTGKRDRFPIRSGMTKEGVRIIGVGQVGRPAAHELPGTSARTSSLPPLLAIPLTCHSRVRGNPYPDQNPPGFGFLPLLTKEGAGGWLTHSKMKNKPIFSHHTAGHRLAANRPSEGNREGVKGGGDIS